MAKTTADVTVDRILREALVEAYALDTSPQPICLECGGSPATDRAECDRANCPALLEDVTSDD